MNRRNFLRLIGLTVASPALPLSPGTAIKGQSMTLTIIDEFADPTKNYCGIMAGMLKDVYLPTLIKVTMEDTPIIELIKMKDVYK